MKSLDNFKYLWSKYIDSRLGRIIFLPSCYAFFVLSITVNVCHKIIPIKTSMVYPNNPLFNNYVYCRLFKYKFQVVSIDKFGWTVY